MARWGRPLAFAAAILFLISLIFPTAAGLAKDTGAFPKWWGLADVSLAFVLAIVVIAMQALVRGKVNRQADEATYRTYRILTHGVLAVAVVVMLFSDHIQWFNCATGFLWRIWLLLSMLPSWFTALAAKQ